MPLTKFRFLCNRKSCQSKVSTAKTKTQRLCSILLCATCILTSPAIFADAFFGFGVSDGDRKLTWLKNDVSVADELNRQYDEHWQDKEEDINNLDYDAYVKTFKWYMVFQQKF